jgi:SHS2 domain-containing protein
MFEVFEHTADLGLRVRAEDLPALLVEAAKGLFSTIVDLGGVRPVEQVELRVEGREPDYLLFDWLNELLYLFDTRHLVLCEFDVQLDRQGLTAQARGEPMDPGRHTLEHEVKAITYHALKVEQQPDGWLAEVILDI